MKQAENIFELRREECLKRKMRIRTQLMCFKVFIDERK